MALSLGNRLPCLIQYDAPDIGYLSLQPGQEVTIQYIGGSEDPDWLYGSSEGRRGWFPKFCVLNAPRSPPPPLPPPPPPLDTSPLEQESEKNVTPAVTAAVAQLEDDVLELLIQDELARRPKLKHKIMTLAAAWRCASEEISSPERLPQKAHKNGSLQDPTMPPLERPCAPEGAEPLPTSVKRTFCKFWQENKCTKGDACTFAHGHDEIGQPIPDEMRPAKSGDGSRKKILCKFWQEGKCSKGPGCTFAHGDHELGKPIDAELARLFASRRSDLCGLVGSNKLTPCKYWQEGKCAKGETCTFQHVGTPGNG